MKNLITILILTFASQFINAQKFIETDRYVVVNKVTEKQQEYTAFFDIISIGNNAQKVTTIGVSDLDTFDGIVINVLPNPNLENIKEIIRIDTNYSACCGHTDAYYIMVTDDNDFISLPKIENTYCDEAVSEVQYIFPKQAFGKENMVIKTEITYSANIENVKSTKILQSLVWNDDIFNDGETIAYSQINKR